MIFIYDTFLTIFYKLFAPLLSFFSKDIKVWLNEQRKIKNFTEKINSKKKIWFHCSSVGEYEQIKSIINYFKKNNHELIITFFSPGAYKYLKGKLEIPCLLFPLDTKKNINQFIEQTSVKAILIAKNEIWPNLINSGFKKNIPIFIIAAKIKKSKIKNIIFGSLYCSLLKKINIIFVQDEHSKKILNTKNIPSIVSGDPRVDQVILDREKKVDNKLIKKFISKKEIVLAGSTEKSDYSIIKNLMNYDEKKWIIVPHKNSKEEINEILNIVNQKWCLYSNPQNLDNSKIMIIDKIGILKFIYKYANVVYIGGGFSKGIHNCLEPAIFGKKILFGPKYKSFPEANHFINEKIAFCVKNQKEFEDLMSNKKNKPEEIKLKTKLFFKYHQGASKKIITELKKIIH